MEEFLQNGEDLKMTLRKHWIVYVGDALLHGFGGVLCIVVVHYALVARGFFSFAQFTLSNVAMILVAVILLFWTSFFFAWTKNYFDVWFITDQHIVAVNQKELFEREESFMELVRIQDVFFEKEGMLSVWLHYGALRIQSAGTEQQFVMRYVQEVEVVAHTIMDLRDKVKHQEV
jgi:hypothetical protein